MTKHYLVDLFYISLEAGREILDVYAQDFEVELKEDDSPLTQADKRAHELIMMLIQ